MTDHDLMRRRADVLFTHDARGRMLRTNEPRAADRQPAPRLWLGCTAAGHVLRFGATVVDGDAARWAATIHDGLTANPTTDVAATLAAVRAALMAHTDLGAAGGGPAFRFPSPLPPPGDTAIRLTGANRALLRDTFPWLYAQLDEWEPCFGVVRAGAVVSVCFSARLSADAAEAGVETLPDHRGHGHAAAVTAAWGAAIAATGRVPLYSTAWENHASRRVAGKLGLIAFGADATWW